MNYMTNDPAMGELGYERVEHDWYSTPEWVTDAIVPEIMERLCVARAGVSDPDTIWEPACGDGRMAKQILRACGNGIKVKATDLVDRGYGRVRDFLTVQRLSDIDVDVRGIVTNPPYGKLAIDFADHALALMKPVKGFVALLLRNEWDSAKDRQRLFGDNDAFAKKIVLTSRPRWIEGTTGSPRHNFSWFVWDFAKRRGQVPEIAWHVRKGKGD
jgi:hypothetical protein